MFFGRRNELNDLNERYRSMQFECAIVYGRRRVGKTTLINEFIKDKKAIYFQAQQTNDQMNLDLFSQSIHQVEKNKYGTSFQDFSQAFEYIGEMCKKEKIILFIDEYPYLAEAVDGISSLLQEYIDRYYSKEPNLMIILCGSSLSFMQNQVLGYQSPLYGRRTAQYHIQPLSIWEAKEMLPAFTNEELFIAYSLTAGIPAYLSYMNDKESIEINIRKQFLNPNSYLFQEPKNLLLQELKEPARYDAIIQAIAQGATKRSEISTKTGIPNGTIGNYLTTLMEIGIIKRETPLFQKEGKKSLYILADSFFLFWYRFIPSNLDLIERQLPELAWQNIAPHLSDWLGSTFESICLDWCFKMVNKLPFPIQHIGRWWGNNPIEKKQEEIDLIAYRDNQAIFMECKYRNQIKVKQVKEDIIRKSELFPDFNDKYYILFTKENIGVNKREASFISISLDEILEPERLNNKLF